MTKNIVISFIFLLGLGTWAMGDSAGPITPSSPAPLGNFKIEGSLTQWQTRGEFVMHGGPPVAANTWELKHPVDSDLLIFQLKLTNIDPAFAPVWFKLSFGGGDIKRGTIRDTDWDASGNLWFLSHSSSDGMTQLRSFDFGCPITDLFKPSNSSGWQGKLEGTLGYFYLKNSVDYNDPHLALDNYVVTNTSWTEHWLEYELVYNGIGLGLSSNLSYDKKFNLTARLDYVPSLSARYKGVRYPQRPTGTEDWNQHRERITADGTAFSAEIKARIDLSKKLNINLGYKYLKCETEGEDTPDGYWKWIGSREELDTELSGFSFGVNINF